MTQPNKQRRRTMRDVIGKLLKDNNMPDTPAARAIYRKMLEPDDDTQVYKKPWVSLTDAEIWSAVDRIGTADSDVNPYITIKDARAIEKLLKDRNE